MNEEQFLESAKRIYKYVYKRFEEPETPDTVAQNITLTLTPEAMLTVLICVGAADDEAVKTANVGRAYNTKVKPASTISLYHTLRQQAREAGITS